MQPSSPPVKFTPYQSFVVAALAFLQFTIILDFMILSPLGAILIPSLNITPSQFGFVVSAYAFSAGLSGLIAAGFADRFDRKRLLLFFYCGFVLGTLFCGLAPTYGWLLAARMFTGLFGGVIGSIVMAITTDLFPWQMRGRVMGYIQTALSASQVLGIPLGLYFSNLWGWHAPFIMIVAVSIAIGVVIFMFLKPIDAHLAYRVDRNPFHHLFATLTHSKYLMAYAATALLTTGGFMLMPFGSAFSVNNLKISLGELPTVYMVTGIVSMIAGPFIGRLSDRIGKFKLFWIGSLWACAVVAVYTQFGPTPLWLVIASSVLLFIGISSRMISSQALVSAVPEANDRGAFMAVNASLQQISGGIAASLAGLIVVQNADGHLDHYDRLGFVVIGAMLVTIFLMKKINTIVHAKKLDTPVRVGKAV